MLGQVTRSVHVVCEATGGYERDVVTALHDASVPLSVLNPARVRHFARATGQPSFPMYAVSNTAFRLRVVPAEVVFDDPTEGGKTQNAILHQNGAILPMRRILITQPTAERLKAYEGQFYSAELGVTYDVFVRDGALKVHYPRGDIDLEPIGNDAFAGAFPIGSLKAGAFPIGSLKFVCGADGECNALSIDDGRVQNLRFVRVAITPVGPNSAG